MPSRWARQRTARRQAKAEAREAREAHARERAPDVVRDLAAPLVEAGVARLDSVPSGVTLLPTNPGAASAEVSVDGSLVTLCVGPRGNSHELVVDDDGEWERELRACLEAIVAGRYRESASPGRVSRQVVTMTFEMPDGEDIVVKHHELDEGEPGETPAPTERRFAGYVSA